MILVTTQQGKVVPLQVDAKHPSYSPCIASIVLTSVIPSLPTTTKEAELREIPQVKLAQ